eukprot:scaffold327_cov257-Pinguiococcus_pyrenoidosus.AAC.47
MDGWMDGGREEGGRREEGRKRTARKEAWKARKTLKRKKMLLICMLTHALDAAAKRGLPRVETGTRGSRREGPRKPAKTVGNHMRLRSASYKHGGDTLLHPRPRHGRGRIHP